jgi:ABC-type glycerol-3-phosphate transport system substrate-binding protein
MRNDLVWTRRQFLGTAALVAAGTTLAACTPKTPQAPQDQPAKADAQAPVAKKQGVHLEYWVFWGQLRDCIEQFEATEELKEALGDNTWEMKTGVSSSEVFPVAIAGGTPPDIGASGRYLDYMSRDQCVPIEPFVATSKIVKPELFVEGNWHAASYEGVQYGVPANEGFLRRGLNYNERMVAEAGLNPDTPPQTWPELMEWHKALTKFDGAGNLLQIGIDPYDAEGGVGGGNDGFFLSDSWGFKWFDEETKKFNFDHELMAEGLETMGEFIRHIGPDNLVGMRGVEGQGTWGGAYNAEVQAMIIEGYWHAGETMHEKPEVGALNRCTWVPVPEARRGTKLQGTGGHMVLLFKGAKNTAEAWPIAEFLQTRAACDIIFKTIGWLPAYLPYFDHVDPKVFPGLEFYFNSLTEANEWWEPARCEIQTFVSTTYNQLREAVYRNDMTGREAASRLQKACEDEWAQSGF